MTFVLLLSTICVTAVLGGWWLFAILIESTEPHDTGRRF